MKSLLLIASVLAANAGHDTSGYGAVMDGARQTGRMSLRKLAGALHAHHPCPLLHVVLARVFYRIKALISRRWLMLQKSLFLALGVVGLAIFSSVARAAEPASVRVTLSDGQNGSMSLTLSPSKVAPGPVEFTIANKSHTMKHEFLILPWSGSDAALPYSAKTQQVKEDQLKGLQGVEDVNPRETVTAQFSLKAGRYLVFCNEPGHYRAAMRTDLLVGKTN